MLRHTSERSGRAHEAARPERPDGPRASAMVADKDRRREIARSRAKLPCVLGLKTENRVKPGLRYVSPGRYGLSESRDRRAVRDGGKVEHRRAVLPARVQGWRFAVSQASGNCRQQGQLLPGTRIPARWYSSFLVTAKLVLIHHVASSRLRAPRLALRSSAAGPFRGTEYPRIGTGFRVAHGRIAGFTRPRYNQPSSIVRFGVCFCCNGRQWLNRTHVAILGASEDRDH